LEHAADDEALERIHAVMVDGLDLRAGHGQALLERGHRQAGVGVLAEPFDGDPHWMIGSAATRARGRAGPSWARTQEGSQAGCLAPPEDADPATAMRVLRA